MTLVDDDMQTVLRGRTPSLPDQQDRQAAAKYMFIWGLDPARGEAARPVDNEACLAFVLLEGMNAQPPRVRVVAAVERWQKGLGVRILRRRKPWSLHMI